MLGTVRSVVKELFTLESVSKVMKHERSDARVA